MFIILFTDNEEHAGQRQQLMEQHLAFLERNATTVRAAGPLRDEAGGAAGGLWIVEAESRAEIEQLIREDPFWPSGLRRGVAVLEWKQVFSDGERRG